jgi:TolB-like protein/Flp pilus assembly protein TadD
MKALRHPRSLAVLYFQHHGGSRKDAYFRDGLTEDVIVELSRIQGLFVLPRSAVLPYRDRAVDAVAVGDELNVSHVLDGTLHRLHDRLRVTVQFVDARSGRTLWAERYDRRVEDVFAIRSEIVRSIVEALQVMLSPEERRAVSRIPTASVEAYEFYLHGRQHFRQFRRRSIEHARDMFARAVEIDPAYAGAYAGLADCHSYLYMFWESSVANLEEAERASRRAVDLDGDLAEARVARGVAASIAKRHDEAEEEFRQASRIDPGCFEAFYFNARGYYARGLLDRAVYWFRRACEARPEDYQAPCLLGSALAGLGLKTESDAAYREAVERARAHLEVTPGETRALYFWAISLCQLGEDKELALQLAGRALALDPEEPQVQYNVACAYALLGKTDEAIDCLTRTVEHGEWWRGWMEHDPDLAALHAHPRFRELVSTGD